MKHIDYNENPFIVIWEVTRACALSCVHCRAEAQFHRYENELDTEVGISYLILRRKHRHT